MTELSSAERFEIWQQFIARWPIEKLQNLTLEEYNALGSKDSFCYWLESKTDQLGSMWGGSAFKFGIFEYNQQNDKETSNTSILKDDKYKWMKKYGSTTLEAFNKVKEIIVKVAYASAEGKLELIDKIDLGQVTKWKIAFLYQNQENIKIPCVYKEESLRLFLGNQAKKSTVSELYKEIMKKNTKNEDIFAFSTTIWAKTAEKLPDPWLYANYDPGFTADEWYNILTNEEITSKESLNVLQCVKKTGGKATCTQLAEQFGNTWQYYNSNSAVLGKKIINSMNCPAPQRADGSIPYWAVLYTGKGAAKDDNGTFIWKLRDKLSTVLEKLDPDNMENPMITELKDLLISSKQIILTGAPGTGKTYLAKQVAKMLTGTDENIAFCQFHPSFDYTDFVEGLRPMNCNDGTIGFERKDGIFKAFCKKALKNYLDSQKSQQVIEAEGSAQEQIDNFLNEAVELRLPLKTTNGNEFFIREFDDRRIYIEIPNNKNDLVAPYAEVHKIISEKLELGKPGDIKNIFNRTLNRQHDSYVYIICKKIYKQKKTVSTVNKTKVELKNFVFIIDEINRGDISKIFGELFYAVDPGYRGMIGKVTTQYDNLIDETDLYYGGFYIPKNVYIIGTMNDIDRSVESMDFAIRRRFTWKEVEAKDATGMWDTAIPEHKDSALAVMNRLNDAIEKTESLSKAFHIGPAYFLKLKEYDGDIQKLWDLHIMPLLKEYLRGMFDSATALEKLKTSYFGTSDSSAEE